MVCERHRQCKLSHRKLRLYQYSITRISKSMRVITKKLVSTLSLTYILVISVKANPIDQYLICLINKTKDNILILQRSQPPDRKLHIYQYSITRISKSMRVITMKIVSTLSLTFLLSIGVKTKPIEQYLICLIITRKDKLVVLHPYDAPSTRALATHSSPFTPP